jgi:hypothetical protein
MTEPTSSAAAQQASARGATHSPGRRTSDTYRTGPSATCRGYSSSCHGSAG